MVDEKSTLAISKDTLIAFKEAKTERYGHAPVSHDQFLRDLLHLDE